MSVAPALESGSQRWWPLLALILLLPPLTIGGGFLLFLRAIAAPPPSDLCAAQGIAVLTGGPERIATGFALLAAGRGERLLISGVHPAVGMGEIAAAAGMDITPWASRVTIGYAAASTRGNAAEIAAWARAYRLASLCIVTADYHMPRAMLEMRRVLRGGELFAQPVPDAARSGGSSSSARPARRLLTFAGEYGRLLAAWAGLSALGLSPREGGRR